MALRERGRTGIQTDLTADEITGLVLQDEFSPQSSRGGLTGADGNITWGVPFMVVFYFKHTTTAAEQVTNSAPMGTDSPFKFRVLGVKVRCITSQSKEFTPEYGHLKIALQDNDGSGNFTAILPHTDIGDMESGDVREFEVVHQGTSTISKDQGFRCRFLSKADSAGVNPTVEFIVEVQCLRVI